MRVTVDGGTNRWVDFVKGHIGPDEQLKAPDLVTGDFDSCTDESMSYVTRLNCRVSSNKPVALCKSCRFRFIT